MLPKRPFRFGVQSYTATSPTEWKEKARKAEDRGYSCFHLADHYIGPGAAIASTGHPIQGLAAVPAIAVAAEATSRIRVGCRVFCIDYHHPVVLAKEAATLDFFSGGRLELGLGAGWLEAEYRAMDIPFDPPIERIGRLAEVIAIVKAHFSPGEVAFHGRRWTIEGFEGVPTAVQRPHPPIMVGGGGRRVLELAAREADVVSLNFNNRSGVIGREGVGSSTAEATAKKMLWIRNAAGDRAGVFDVEIGAYFTFVTADATALAAGLGSQFGLSAEDMRRHPHALIGSIDEICDELVRRRETYGINYITVNDGASEAFAPVVARLAGT
jgi:probable F420-dependent oxidoreductase